MKHFTRGNSLFSLCGLNCGLCSMRLGGHCGGCGFGNQTCPLTKCSIEHGAIEYCFQCGEYPCEKYDRIDAYDSFITHQRRKSDLQKAQQIGIENYTAEQVKKTKILNNLLDCYNDGRKKTLFCVAVNLLELDELAEVVKQADTETQGMPIKEKAAFISSLLQLCAANKGIELKLKKKRGMGI
mgnify:FL=1